MADYFDALNTAHQQGYTYDDIAAFHADQGWDAPPQPSLMQLAGDITPLRPGSVAPYGVPGTTGDLLNQMQENNITGYTYPRDTPAPVPFGGENPVPVNENLPNG